VAGRFLNRHKRFIRDVDDKSNKQIMDKVLIQSIGDILASALIFIVIGILRENPLPTGILDVFFLKISDHSSLCITEFIYILKIPPNS
jgi:hypothetical protein